MKIYGTLFIASLFFPSMCNAQDFWRIVKEELIFNNPPFAQCHASTIVEINPNKQIVAYFAGTDEGNKDVGIWLSTQVEGKWNQPVLIADGVINDYTSLPLLEPGIV